MAVVLQLEPCSLWLCDRAFNPFDIERSNTSHHVMPYMAVTLGIKASFYHCFYFNHQTNLAFSLISLYLSPSL